MSIGEMSPNRPARRRPLVSPTAAFRIRLEAAAPPDLERESTTDEPAVSHGPQRCPSCGGAGYLDHIDLGHKVQSEHCQKCGERWTRPIDWS
jgi:hypothetical protein